MSPVVALINDKGVAQAIDVNLISTQQIEHVDRPLAGCLDHAGYIEPALPRQHAEIKPTNAACGEVQKIKPIPAGLITVAVLDEAVALDDIAHRRKDRIAIRSRHGSRPENEHGPLRFRQGLGDVVTTVGNLGECLTAGPEVNHGIGQIRRRSDTGNRKAALEMPLAQTRIHQRGLVARIGTDQQTEVRVFNAGDGGIEKVGAARFVGELRAVLATIEIR